MLFDDRLATVLRHAAHSEAAARIQYRQLLDLLGSMPPGAASELVEAAYQRLEQLAGELPPAMQSAILRAPGLRLRNRELVAWLAQGEPQAAAAAMATAQLGESDWLYLIPRLPLTARGFLRHRRNLPFSARQVLERLGVKDLVLPEPTQTDAPAALFPSARKTDADARAEPDAGIGALVRRIEAFQRARRREGATAPRLSVERGRETVHRHPRPSLAFDFATDVQGAVSWADPAIAPSVVGLRLAAARPGAVAALEEPAARTMNRRLPLRGARVSIDGVPGIAGEWRIDAAPAFAPETGHFAGYHGRMRRPQRTPAPGRPAPASDRMRQLLHELRTPINAIQGFAELIQQQMFGPAPNEYRALAAAIAVDAARLMAGFDEIDRLARLEAGALRLGEGACDMREVLAAILRRLEGALRPRGARIELTTCGSPFTVGMTEADAQQLAWRLLATLAGTIAPGEVVQLKLTNDGPRLTLEADLPAALAGEADVFTASAPAQPRAISAGMFGTGFTLRLARAEAEAAGGALERRGDSLRLELPALTASRAVHRQERPENGGPAAA